MFLNSDDEFITNGTRSIAKFRSRASWADGLLRGRRGLMTDDPLREEHEALQRAVKASRQAFQASPDSAFVKAMRGAMDDYSKMREQGVKRDDAVKGIEAVLRANWPHAPSRFPSTCDACEDTGWREHRCTHGHRCGRSVCAHMHPAQTAYVPPCDCHKGDGLRPRVATPDDNIDSHRSRQSQAEVKGIYAILNRGVDSAAF